MFPDDATARLLEYDFTRVTRIGSHGRRFCPKEHAEEQYNGYREEPITHRDSPVCDELQVANKKRIAGWTGELPTRNVECRLGAQSVRRPIPTCPAVGRNMVLRNTNNCKPPRKKNGRRGDLRRPHIPGAGATR